MNKYKVTLLSGTKLKNTPFGKMPSTVTKTITAKNKIEAGKVVLKSEKSIFSKIVKVERI